MRQITIIGNVCADPKSITTKNGNRVVKMRIAAHEREMNQAGTYEKRTEFFNVDIWHGVDAIMDNVKKGRTMAVTGMFSAEKWVDKSGDEQTTLCVRNASWWFLPKSAEEKPKPPRKKSTIPVDLDDSEFPW